ncbi:CBO0543 family protein [Bacillus alkalicellulosilyticus]|uniref:CBO0543 family protein n=1 Tax=Alkalihalobacterium alkalicellulosilyticum TaxID=1912214 RepID=UPI0011178EFB|nr:CBO0543 family protein [Bacillus alkalicellulosilyticus]
MLVREYVMLSFFTVTVIAALFKRMKNTKQVLLFFSYILLLGQGISFFSNLLIDRGYLAFPHRPYPKKFAFNIIYDYILLPIFSLLLIDWAFHKRKLPLATAIFTIFTVIQDLLIIRYTRLLRFKKWKLSYTLFGSIISFLLWFSFYKWLYRKFN